MESTVQPTALSKASVWTGRVISTLVVLFLVFDGVTKVLKVAPVLEASARLGLPINITVDVGIVLLICTAVYVIPQTSILGAVLLTGYLGGAVAIQIRAGSPLFSEALFPVYFAMFMWVGLFLRDERLRVLIATQSSN
jgi:hypothetical protein